MPMRSLQIGGSINLSADGHASPLFPLTALARRAVFFTALNLFNILPSEHETKTG
jgi:hypothetical protein